MLFLVDNTDKNATMNKTTIKRSNYEANMAFLGCLMGR